MIYYYYTITFGKEKEGRGAMHEKSINGEDIASKSVLSRRTRPSKGRLLKMNVGLDMISRGKPSKPSRASRTDHNDRDQ